MTRTAARAFVGVGANLGCPTRQVRRAFHWLSHRHGVSVVRCSSIMFSPPVGPPQPAYANAVVEIRTRLGPLALLDALHDLERAANRRRTIRWGARTLDLDLLLYDERVVELARLTLPHPRMHERRFVLKPLVEIAPHVRHPRLDRTASDLLRSLEK